MTKPEREIEKTLEVTRRAQAAESASNKTPGISRRPLWIAAGLSIAWTAGFVATAYTFGNLALGPLAFNDFALLIAGIFAPMTVFWLIALVFQRTNPVLEDRKAFMDALDTMLTPVEAGTDKLVRIEKTIRRHVDQINAALDATETRSAKIGKELQQQLGQAFAAVADAEARAVGVKDVLARERVAMDELASSLEERAATLSTSLADAGRNVDERAEAASNALDNAGQRLSDRITALEVDLEPLLKTLDERRTALAEVGEKARQDMVSTAKSLHDELEHAGEAVISFRADLEGIEGIASKSGKLLADRAEKMTELNERINIAARSGTQALSDQEGSARDALSSGNQLIEELCERLVEVTELANRKIEESASTNESRLQAMAEIIEARIDSTAEHLRGQFQSDLQTANQMAAMFSDKLKALGPTLNQETQRIHHLSTRLADHADLITAASDKAATSLSEAGTVMDSRSENMGQFMEATSRGLKELADELAERQNEFAATAAAASDELAGISERYSEETEAFAGATGRATEAAEEAADRTAKASEEAAERTAQAAEQAAERIHTVGDNLDKQNTALVEAIQMTSDVFEVASQNFTGERESLISGTDKIIERLEKSADVMRARADEISEASEKSGDSFAAISKIFAEAANNLKVSTEHATTRAEDASRSMTQNIARALDELNQDFHKEIGELTDQASGDILMMREMLSKTLELAAEDIRDARKMAGQERDLALADMRSASDTIIRQSDELMQAIDARERALADRMRDDFLKTASLMIEQMQSSAIDIARLTSVEVPDREWRRYLGGESNVFARALVKLAPKDLRKRIKERLKNNEEFRKYAVRYVKDFEALIARASADSRSRTLSVTLISSEIGRLYVVLAQCMKRLN